MAMDREKLSGILALAREHSGKIVKAGVKTGFLWGTLAMFLSFAIYWFLRTGPTGRPSLLSGIVLGLALLFVFIPAIATAGGIIGVRNGALKALESALGKVELLRPVGNVLVSPTIAAHLVAEGRLKPTDLPSLDWSTLQSEDASFLLTEDRRTRAFDSLTGDLVDAAVRRVPGQETVRKNRLGAWLLDRAAATVSRSIGKKAGPYAKLFDGLKADASGAPDVPGARLSFDTASQQVGAAFFVKILRPLAKKPFNTLRLQLLLVAFAALALAVVLTRFVIS